MDESRELVFVYGTLRRGGSNHFRMDGAGFHGAATLRGRIYRFDWYPGLVLDESGVDISGELYAVGPAQLAELDRFEGLSAGEIEGSEYRRVQVSVTSEAGPVNAWVWEWIGPVHEANRIPGGDWLQATET
jgi:gamma-glutamylcyclotransferase (GGCT)/AIG2-like uncharacterized protein YtfP